MATGTTAPTTAAVESKHLVTAEPHPWTVTFDAPPNRRGWFVLSAPDRGEAELLAELAMSDGEHIVQIDLGEFPWNHR